DLKNGAGGLRDVQSLRWAAAALVGTASLDALVAAGHLGAADRTRLARAARVVLNIRVALHQVTGTRPGLATTDLLHMGVHGRVARRLGFEDADAPAAVLDLDPDGPRAQHPARASRPDHPGSPDPALPAAGAPGAGVPAPGLTRPEEAPATGAPVDLAEHRLLRELYLATRTIDHVHRRAWRLIEADRRDGRRRTRPTERTVDVFELHGGVLRIPDDVDLATPELATRLFAALVDTGAVLDRTTAHRLRVHTAEGHRWRWTSRDRESFVATLWRGRLMLPALAELDDTGMLVALLPEWEIVRGRAQRNPYHRFALDRHAWHAVAELGELVRRHRWAAEALELVEDREGLLLGVLFHDVGKALGEPHEVTGVRLARTMARRMGAPTATVECVGRLTRLHLLLGVARTRDVTDRALAEQLADVVGDHSTLAALHLLTAADGLATGSRVYNDWTAGLIAALVTRVSAVLDSIDPDQIADDAVATARAAQQMAEEMGATEDGVREHLALLPSRYAALLSPRAVVRHTLMAQTRPGPGEVRTRVTPADQDPDGVEGFDVLDVVALDHPGWFAKVAGVIALHGGEIVAAEAFGRDDGLAFDTFRVRPPDGAAGSWWARVEGDLVDAGAGRLAVRARVGRMADQQAHRVARLAAVPTTVTAEPEASGRATVVEVRTLDRVGVLYAITAALAELEVDIVVARIDTVGHEANDAFTCRNAEGGPLDDDHVREVQMAITAAIDELSSSAA
ncbi:MAG: hypothetical protein WD041_03890, partial [Nitriliruptoraceae bacterium]